MKYLSFSTNIYILLIIILNVTRLYCISFRQLSIEVKNSNCSLSGMMLLNYYLIKCPTIEDRLHVILGPGNRTKIKCFDVEYDDFEKILPTLTLGNITAVEIWDCPLAVTKPLKTILQKLGIIQCQTLVYHNTKEKGHILNKINFRQLNVLRNLTLIMDSLTYVPEDLFNESQLECLESVDLFSNLTSLPVNLFRNLINVEFIKLGRSLQYLPYDMFRYQTKLIELSLNDNKLANVSKELFRFNTNLQSLNLENNLLEALEPGVFDLLDKLRLINLNGNRFSTLPDKLFINNIKLEEFNLINNQVPLANLPLKLFANLPRLDKVELSCGLKEILPDIFENSAHLVEVSLADNKLMKLPHNIFVNQKFLKYLNISKNNLQFLPEDLLKHTTDLELFDVSFNNLTNITSDLFNSCSRLEILLLNNNQLTAENTYLLWPFRYHHELKTLDLSHNLITKIPNDWFVPFYLEVLDLSYNNIMTLSDAELINFIKYNLQLILTHNQIKTIYITNYTNDVKDFQNLRLKVDLNYNPIQCDCELQSFVEIFRKPNTEYMLMESVQLLIKNLTCWGPNDLKGEIVKNLELSSLICEHKQDCPSKCSCYIRSFDQLLVVNCSNRLLKTVPQLPTIEKLSVKGIELNMQHNELSRLPTTLEMPGYSNVTKLLLKDNLLKQMERSQLPLNLTYLDIRNNFLETLNIDTLKFMNNSKLSQIYLSNNSWVCDCDARPLLRFCQNNVKLFKDFSNMTCANTENPTFFYDLQDFCVEDQSLSILLFIFTSFLSLVLILYYKFQTEIKIWLYAHNMCLWLVAVDELDQDKIYDAFISYSAKDEDFVLDVLVPELENGQPQFRLCVHVRDWSVGDCIPDQILRSIAESKKTIIILSKNFIESVWAKLEFKVAHQAALTENRAKVIVIIYEDIDNIDTLDEDLKTYLKMNTYLKWGDPWFWEKLRYAMPHVTHQRNDLFANIPLRDRVDVDRN